MITIVVIIVIIVVIYIPIVVIIFITTFIVMKGFYPYMRIIVTIYKMSRTNRTKYGVGSLSGASIFIAEPKSQNLRVL